MEELAAFYCPKCGHCIYYQTSRHPQCSKCGTQEAMYVVRMHYVGFIRMSCDERGEFLSRGILKTNPSLITRLAEPHRHYNSREIIAEMNSVVMNLDIGNKILSDTVKWAHDTIWEPIYEKRESGQDKVPARGVCRDRQPSEKSMEEAVETKQAEATYSEAATADMSQTTAPKRGRGEQLTANSKKPNLKNI